MQQFAQFKISRIPADRVDLLDIGKPLCEACKPDWAETREKWKEGKLPAIFLCEDHAREFGSIW